MTAQPHLATPTPSTLTRPKRVQVRPWAPPPSTMPSPSRRAGSLTPLDTSTATATATASPPGPASAPAARAQPLKLEVLDVTCSAVALSVFTPPATKPPSISILLDRRPWPHVAHAGSAPVHVHRELGLETTVIVYGLDPNREYEIGFEVSRAGADDSSDPTAGNPRRGSLESNPDFAATTGHLAEDALAPAQATLDAPPPPYSPSPSPLPPVHHAQQQQSASSSTTSSVVPVSSLSTTVTTASSLASPSSNRPQSEPRHPGVTSALAPDEDSDDSTTSAKATTPMAAAAAAGAGAATIEPVTHFANEDQLRQALKQLRATSKRNEQQLVATLTSLRKSVEKAAKEDQRARSRIVALEDAIRKAGIVETEVRGRDKVDVEERLREAQDEEARVKGQLDEWKDGGGVKPTTTTMTTTTSSSVVSDGRDGDAERVSLSTEPRTNASYNNGGATSNLAELAKELDALNKAIEAVEREKATKAGEVLRTLEREMTIVEGELIQLDREDAHRATYGPPVPMMPLPPGHPGMAPIVPVVAAPSQTATNSGGGPFNFRWRRGGGGGANVVPVPAPAVAQPDPRSFGRFFRRTTNSAPSPSSAVPLAHLSSPLDLSSTTPSSSSNGTTSATASSSALSLLPAQVVASSSSTTTGSTAPGHEPPPPPPGPGTQVHLQPPSANTSERFAAQQQFAQAHQAQALWAQAQARSNSNPSPSGLLGGPGGGGGGGGRRRAGSLNSVNGVGQYTTMPYGAGGGGGHMQLPGVGGGGGSNSSSPSLAHAQVHASGVQSARNSFDEPPMTRPASLTTTTTHQARPQFPFGGRNLSGGGGIVPEKEPPSSPLGLGDALASARSRSDSTLSRESAKSVESSSTGKTEHANGGGGSGSGSGGGKGKNWAKSLGTWSQVVGSKGTKKGQTVDEVEEGPAGEDEGNHA